MTQANFTKCVAKTVSLEHYMCKL